MSKETEQKVGVQNKIDLSKVFAGYQSAIKDMPNVQVLKRGETVSRYAVEVAKFTKASKARIAILGQFLYTKVHFDNDTGRFICFEGICCERLGAAKQRYVVPILVYTTDNQGKVISLNATVKVLVLWAKQYEQLMSIQAEMGNITGYDLVVTCNDEAYNDISFTATRESMWQNPKAAKLVDFITSELTRIGDKVLEPVARTMTEATFRDKMGMAPIGGDFNDKPLGVYSAGASGDFEELENILDLGEDDIFGNSGADEQVAFDDGDLPY